MTAPEPADLMVVAGEASGDQHAADLLTALARRRPGLRAFGMGGPKLERAGLELAFSAQEISVMGVVEVLPKLPRILDVMGQLAALARARRPQVAVLVDAPDFNLRLAAKLKPLGVKVVQYVSPTVWAWREGRTKTIARVTDELLCILPFEEAFLRARGVNAHYVGNPVVEQLPPLGPPAQFRAQLGLRPDVRTLAVLPGSRRSELARLGALMATVARRVVEQAPTQLVVPVAPGLPREFVQAPFAGLDVRFVEGQAAACVGASDVALVASGTATLEAALMQRPLVCVYRVAPLTYAVGKALVRGLQHFCLVNLLAEERLVPELLQGDATADAVCAALAPLWSGPERERILSGVERVRARLGPPGAADRAAERVLGLLGTPG